jgi:hypothetical protein
MYTLFDSKYLFRVVIMIEVRHRLTIKFVAWKCFLQFIEIIVVPQFLKQVNNNQSAK